MLTVLCWFLPYNNGNQMFVCMCPLPLERPPAPPPTPLGHHKRRAELLCFPAASPSCFTPGGVHRSMPCSQLTPTPSPAMSTSPFSTSASLLLQIGSSMPFF